MIITIHRGSHQIGGCATEIRTENSRILIDAGSELDGNAPLKIEGVTEGTSKCNAVVFSHYHGDHIGLLDTVNNDIPLYIGNISLEIIKMQKKGKGYSMKAIYRELSLIIQQSRWYLEI